MASIFSWHRHFFFFTFLLYRFETVDNEVSLERERKKVEGEKPFKDVAETQNDVRSCEVGPQYLARSVVSVM